MKHRFPAIVAVVMTVVVLTYGCSRHQSSTTVKTVAIATLMSHPALDLVQSEMKSQLAKQGYKEGQNIRYVVRNANGQVQLAANIANELAANKPDVIVAVTTPMAQAVVKTAKCPVVFAAVTDPVGAGLVKSLSKGESTITGTSDAWPYRDQLKLIREILPKARRLGVLYNPGEAASQYGIGRIRQLAPSFGFELVEASASSTGEVNPAAANLANRNVDALFLSSDNTVIGGVAGAVKIAVEKKIPLFVGDSGTVKKGGIAAVSVGYDALGRDTGSLVGRELRGERNIPTIVAKGDDIIVNKRAATLMGVTLPASVMKRAKTVYDKVE